MLTIASMLERQSERHARMIALIDEPSGREWSVDDLERSSAAAAQSLAGAGVLHGDRVGLLSANHPSMVVAYLAVARLGAVLVPFNWRLTVGELEGIATDAGISALIANADLAVTAAGLADRVAIGQARRWWIGDSAGAADAAGTDLEAVIESAMAMPAAPGAGADAGVSVAVSVEVEPAPDDLLYLMYTSGTTGRPKGAMHTHATTLAAAAGAVEAMDYRPGDRYLNVMPLFHVASLAMVNICLRRRCTMVLGRAFDPVGVWRSIERYRIDAMMAVPAMLSAMAQSFDPGLDTSSLRVLSSGAAPVPRPLLEHYHDLGIDVIQAYGLTESGGAVSVLDASDAVDHLGSAGKPILALEMRLRDEQGDLVAAGQSGEIIIRGPAVTTGYWNRPDATADALQDGWFCTGDVGVVDSEGFLTIRDRLTDMLISGGENVYPAEVESVLLLHPDVDDVAVIGIPSERWGESVCAFVVAGDRLDGSELIAWSRERLASFKVPTVVTRIESLPRNASGKVLKHQLRGLVERSHG